jgi:hypothetical protein
LKTAGAENHRLRPDFILAVGSVDADRFDLPLVAFERGDFGIVADFNTELERDVAPLAQLPLAAAGALQAAPRLEVVAAVDDRIALRVEVELDATLTRLRSSMNWSLL